MCCDSAGADTAFVRVVILKRILGKSIEHCGSEACVRAHHATNDWKGESDSRFSSTNRSKPRINLKKMDFFAKIANPICVVNMILDMYYKEIVFI